VFSATPLLLLLALADPAAGQSDPGDPLQPDAVLEIPGGPRLVHFNSPGTDVASLRLSFPVAESSAEAGAGRVLLLAALERVEPIAARVGARIDGVRTLQGLSYTVSGPSAVFDHLAWLLREAVRLPDEGAVERALGRVRIEAERERETPAGVLVSRLREGIAPEIPPSSGSTASLQGMTAGVVRDVWARTHVRERMAVVASGPLPVEVLLAGILDAGVPAGGGGDTTSRSLPAVREGTRAQVLRSWYGEAYAVGTPDDPRTAVAARLMAERLRSLPGRVEAGAELWELGGRAALVVTGAAYPSDATAMRRRIQGLRQEVASGLTPDAVARVVATLRRETLLAARSPTGLVSVVGYHLDATGDPAGARHFLDALEAVDVAAISTLLAELGSRPAVTADVRP
jgi:hypothetical protein